MRALVIIALLAAPALAQDEEKDLLKKARDLVESGDREEGFKTFQEAASLAWKNGHGDAALSALDEAREAAPTQDDKVRVIRLQGHIAIEIGEFDKAVKAYRRAAKLAPDDESVSCLLGYALHLAGDEVGSVEALERSDSQEAKDLLALSYRVSGRPKKALKLHLELAEAQKLQTRSDFVWESKVMKAEGPKGGAKLSVDGRRAAIDLEVAIDHAFCDDLGAAETAIAEVKVDMEELEPALALALDQTLRALELRPKHFQLHYLLALLWEKKGDAEKAKAELAKFSEAAKKLEPQVEKAEKKLKK